MQFKKTIMSVLVLATLMPTLSVMAASSTSTEAGLQIEAAINSETQGRLVISDVNKANTLTPSHEVTKTTTVIKKRDAEGRHW